MRWIEKKREPPVLTTYRAGGGRYDGDSGFPAVKEAIRAALVEEQGAICCYCMQRIKPSETAMKVEHRVPQSVDATRDLDWRNLLGACNGGQGLPPSAQHCDTRKGNTTITLDPTEPSCIGRITIQPGSGRISATDPVLNEELNTTLNLNCVSIVRQRKAAIEGFFEAILRKGHRREQTVDDTVFERQLARYAPASVVGALDPFCEAIACAIRHRLGGRSRED